MDKELFDGLVASMKEAVAISKGEMQPSRVFHVNPLDVKAIREKAGLSQSELAKMMRVSVRTLQNWEQGRRKPTGPASALIRIFERAPQSAVQALRGRTI